MTKSMTAKMPGDPGNTAVDWGLRSKNSPNKTTGDVWLAGQLVGWPVDQLPVKQPINKAW